MLLRSSEPFYGRVAEELERRRGNVGEVLQPGKAGGGNASQAPRMAMPGWHESGLERQRAADLEQTRIQNRGRLLEVRAKGVVYQWGISSLPSPQKGLWLAAGRTWRGPVREFPRSPLWGPYSVDSNVLIDSV